MAEARKAEETDNDLDQNVIDWANYIIYFMTYLTMQEFTEVPFASLIVG